jgi:uncharacterized protein with ATP-grasp and redox domains
VVIIFAFLDLGKNPSFRSDTKKRVIIMLIQIDCIPCLLKLSLSAVRKITRDQGVIEAFFKKILMMDALRGLKWDMTPPEVLEIIALELAKMDDSNPDPFSKVKKEQNGKALRLHPWLMGLLEQSLNPFFTAVKLSIAGNLVDSVIGDDVQTLQEEVKKVLERELNSGETLTFFEKIESSRMILYFGDNCGEIVFDRVLIEFIRENSKADIVFVVRSDPALNDVTLKEAFSVGMDRVARIIENGIFGPLPGTIISRCSPETQELYRKADLIISKGGANYETLSRYGEPGKDTTFLTIAKCFPYCRHFEVDMHDPIIRNVYA